MVGAGLGLLRLGLNVIGLMLFAALFGLTLRRRAVDPVCGMAVDRAQAERAEHNGHTIYFCCAGCRETSEADPERYLRAPKTPPATVKDAPDGHAKHRTVSLTDANIHRHDD